MARWSVEVPSGTAEDEDRRQRKQKQGEGKPSGPQRGFESVEYGHASETDMKEGERSIGYYTTRTDGLVIAPWAKEVRLLGRDELDLPNTVAVDSAGIDPANGVLRKDDAR